MGTVGVIDIGSYSAKVVIASVEEEGFPEVLGIGEEKIKGIERGNVVKASTARRFIKKALKLAEETAGEIPEKLYIIFSHPAIKGENEKVSTDFGGELVDISEEHLEDLKKKVLEQTEEKGFKVIHVIPRYFLLDGEKYYEPLDMTASKIEAEYHVVKIPKVPSRNMEKLITSLKYIPADKFFGAYAASKAVFDEEELEKPTVLIDLGHTTTSYVYFEEGSPKFSGVLDIGGRDITEEISRTFKIPLHEAERLKHDYAVASRELVETDEEILAKDKEGNDVTVKLSELAAIAERYTEEVFGRVFEELYKKGVTLEEIEEVVLIGGGAYLGGIKEFLKGLGFTARIGIPQNISSLMDKAMEPKYAALLGALQLVGNDSETEGFFEEFLPPKESAVNIPELEGLTEKRSEKKKGILSRFFGFFKNIFSED